MASLIDDHVEERPVQIYPVRLWFSGRSQAQGFYTRQDQGLGSPFIDLNVPLLPEAFQIQGGIGIIAVAQIGEIRLCHVKGVRDAEIPENSYAARLVSALDWNGINKAIGGEIFCPELAGLPDDVTPDLITVAYGTNDWSRFGRLTEDTAAFFRTLRSTYPASPIILLAPVWRADWQDPDRDDFRRVAQTLEQIAGEVGNAHFIDCFGFIPADTDLFSDLYLHPNDEGFRHYAEGLIPAVFKLL